MAGPLKINYDIRTRLVDMEKDPHAALKAFEDTQTVLDTVVERVSLDKQVDLTALTPHKHELASSFGREVSSCTHTVIAQAKYVLPLALVRGAPCYTSLQSPPGHRRRRTRHETGRQLRCCAVHPSIQRGSEGIGRAKVGRWRQESGRELGKEGGENG